MWGILYAAVLTTQECHHELGQSEAKKHESSSVGLSEARAKFQSSSITVLTKRAGTTDDGVPPLSFVDRKNANPSNTLFAECSQFTRLAATHFQARAIVELGNEAPRSNRTKGDDAIEIDDACAVDARKARRIESRFQT